MIARTPATRGWSAQIEFDLGAHDDELHDALFELLQPHAGTPTTTESGRLALVLSVEAEDLVAATSLAVQICRDLMSQVGHPEATPIGATITE
ncbi:hypothetical protein ACFRMQ_00025 [Kitasatospora sp. NPDC056783]|uniref:hypothetical protein n=1 Tax=Kitasatospora sp. NPDC056783 TaxID=3345943 RepID=UPI0036CC490B